MWLLNDLVITVYEYKYKIMSPWVEGNKIRLLCLGDNGQPTGEMLQMDIYEFINNAEVEI